MSVLNYIDYRLWFYRFYCLTIIHNFAVTVELSWSWVMTMDVTVTITQLVSHLCACKWVAHTCVTPASMVRRAIASPSWIVWAWIPSFYMHEESSSILASALMWFADDILQLYFDFMCLVEISIYWFNWFCQVNKSRIKTQFLRYQCIHHKSICCRLFICIYIELYEEARYMNNTKKW